MIFQDNIVQLTKEVVQARAVLLTITAAQENYTSSKEYSYIRLQKLPGYACQLLSFHDTTFVFFNRYNYYFQWHTVNISDKALQYLKGLFNQIKRI